MSPYNCPKCGKEYQKKSAYFTKHVNSCTGKAPKQTKTKKMTSSPKSGGISSSIINRLENIEARLAYLERNFQNFTLSKSNKSKIENVSRFYEVINQKIQLLSKRMLGIQKVYLKDLYLEINKEYKISKDHYSTFLLSLYNNDKIQLEAGSGSDDFSITDNYGNVFKLIRVLD